MIHAEQRLPSQVVHPAATEAKLGFTTPTKPAEFGLKLLYPDPGHPTCRFASAGEEPVVSLNDPNSDSVIISVFEAPSLMSRKSQAEP